MEIVKKHIEEIIPYENNPRMNEKAVEGVANSIKEFGFQNPIILDKHNVIICGHTRLKAAKKLGLEMVPCVVADNLTDEQVKAYRLADNKVAEKSEWDDDKLAAELNEILNIDMSDFGFLEKDLKADPEEKYTQAVNVPQYEITGAEPSLEECCDISKYKALCEEIDDTDGIEDDVRDFLKYAAARHIVFNYKNIAEYYAHAPKEVQELMERSALVIIDYDDALLNGYVRLSKALEEIVGEENET